MKRASSIFIASLTLVTAVLLGVTTSVSAIADHNKMGEQPQAQTAAKSCERLDTVSGKLISNLNQKKSEASDKRADKKDGSKERRQQAVSNLAKQRGEWDAKRAKSFDELRSKATTDEQKTAVEAYITSISSAITTRRASYDSAQASFRSGVDALLAQQRAQGNTATNTLQTQIDTAVAKAKASCQAGTPIDQVLATLKTDIKSAQETFRQSRKATDINPQLTALKKIRKNAFQSATDAYKQASETARTDLKTAFAEQAVTIEN